MWSKVVKYLDFNSLIFEAHLLILCLVVMKVSYFCPFAKEWDVSSKILEKSDYSEFAKLVVMFIETNVSSFVGYKVMSGWQLQGFVHHVREVLGADSWGSWSHGIRSRAAERVNRYAQLTFFFMESEIPAQRKFIQEGS